MATRVQQPTGFAGQTCLLTQREFPQAPDLCLEKYAVCLDKGEGVFPVFVFSIIGSHSISQHPFAPLMMLNKEVRY